MGITKKGSRKIVVDGKEYRWRVGAYRKTSEWRSGEGILSEEYMKYARYYGLGSVRDIVFNVPVELNENPGSKIVMACYALGIDGFLGPEQSLDIKPGLIARLIRICLEKGWKPKQKGDFKVKLLASPTGNEATVLISASKKSGLKQEETVLKIENL